VLITRVNWCMLALMHSRFGIIHHCMNKGLSLRIILAWLGDFEEFLGKIMFSIGLIKHLNKLDILEA
jgi:hypothetical protein